MLIDRAIFRAWRGPFVLALMGIVTVLLLGHVRKLAAAALGWGLTIPDALGICAALVPPLLVFAIPLAHLTAVIVALGRMTDDGEVVALAAAGVSPIRLLRVPIATGMALTAIGLGVAHYAEPAGWRRLQSTLTSVAARNISGRLAGEPGFHRAHDLLFSAEPAPAASGPRSNLGHNVVVVADEGLVVAREAELTFATGHLKLRLHDGEVHPVIDAPSAPYRRARFARAELAIDLQSELRQRTRIVNRDGRLTTAELYRRAEQQGPTSTAGRRYRKLADRRTALPTLAFVFSLIAAAVGLRPGAHRWTAAVGAVAAYYVLMRIGDAAVARSPIALPWAVWGPNGVLMLTGGLAVMRVARPR